MLDAVIDYLPSPLDIPHVDGTLMDGETPASRKADEAEPLSALAFKIATDQHLGKLTYLRIYSGVLENGSQVLNSTKDRKERIGKIYQMHANKREELPRAGAGDIIAVAGLKQTTTGDTLSDSQKPIVLESMTFPAPVIYVAIEPRTKSDQEKLGTAIQKLAEEDPTFQVRTDEETGQTIISGMGELHLEILVDRMRREFKVEANVGKPQVAYRETIRGTVRPRGVHAPEADRWLGPVREGAGQARAPGDDAGRPELRVRQCGDRWAHPEGVHPFGGRRRARGHAIRHPGGLSAGRRPASPCSTAATTRSTRPRWRSRSRDRWCSKPRPARPSRCCSSRCSPSRSRRPRRTWAMSSAT